MISLGLGPNEKLPPPGPTPILPAEQVWSAQFDVAPATGASMDLERVYVPLRVRGLRALSRKDGVEVWNEGTDLAAPPRIEAGVLIAPLPESIRGLDPATGSTRWSVDVLPSLAAPVSAKYGFVLAMATSGELLAIRADDGSVVWRQNVGTPSRHAPALLENGLAVVALAGGRLSMLDLRSGKQVWERAFQGELSPPAVDRDRVFIGSTNNFFYALDARTGREKWKWRTGGDVIGAAVDAGRVYFVSLDNILRAVDRGSGNQLWKTAIPTRPSAPPIALGDAVVLTGVAPRLDAYNGKTGAALGSYEASSDLEGMPVIDETPKPFEVAIVVLSRDGRVTALRPTGLMFPDPPLVPLSKLPGRELAREPRPDAVRPPVTVRP